MKRLPSSTLIWLSIFIGSLGLYVPIALAAPAPKSSSQGTAGQALEIAPPVINLTANPGQILKIQISLRDVSSENIIVSNQINDFIAASEDGTPKILLNNESSDPYSLKDWIAPLPNLLMIPKQIKNVPVTIKVPANASPGGHYGVIRFTAAPPELKGTGVSLSASLGALILIRVSGDVKESLAVQEFTINHDQDGKTGQPGALFESTPIHIVERLKNTGNTHEQPVGQATITDMFGKKIAAVNINLPPRNVLPGSIRRFEQPLNSSVLGNKKLFGRYNAKLVVTYGATKQTLTSNTSFWVIPYRLIGTVIVLLVGGFFALRIFIRNYNRRIISKSQRSQRK